MTGPVRLTPAAFAEAAGVSRETVELLERHAALLERWQRRINLVAAGTLADLWRRHMLDSAQLWPHVAERSGPIADLGSGAGFPGLVLAATGAGPVHLIESDARKAAFLREAAREMGVAVTVHAVRAEAVAPLGAATVTARALAPLPRLLPLAVEHLAPGGAAVLLKGRTVEEELTAARESWTMEVERFPSRTDAHGRILVLREIAPRR